jgi:hypothetical protein
VWRHHGQGAGNAERVFQGIIIDVEDIAIEVAWTCAENLLNQSGRVFLDEIRLLAKEKIAGVDLALCQPFPQGCSKYTRHRIVL